jgi:hypothetical protein
MPESYMSSECEELDNLGPQFGLEHLYELAHRL